MSTLVSVMLGMCLVMASGCVANNVIDRSIDATMERTKKRSIVTGEISITSAVVFSIILGLVGFVILAIGTNWLTVLVGAIAILDYVILYAVAKRRSSLSTVVGSVSGALPPVGGYVALSGTFDGAAILIFLAMVVWQIPHFYAIGLYRGKEYSAAGLPLLTLKRPRKVIQIYCIACIALYMAINAALSIFGYTGLVFGILLTIVSIWWLTTVLRGGSAKFNDMWAKKIFGQSLVVLTLWCTLLIFNYWLP